MGCLRRETVEEATCRYDKEMKVLESRRNHQWLRMMRWTNWDDAVSREIKVNQLRREIRELEKTGARRSLWLDVAGIKVRIPFSGRAIPKG